MKRKRPVFTLVLLAIAALGVVAVVSGPRLIEWYWMIRVGPEELLSRTPWEDPEKASGLARSIERYEGSLVIESGEGSRGEETVTFIRGSKVLHHLKTDETTDFLIIDDRLLIFTEFPPEEPGCHLVALDLELGKPRWRTALESSGKNLFGGSNHASVRRDHPRFITVFTEDKTGRSTQIVDLRTGKVVGSRQESRIEIRL